MLISWSPRVLGYLWRGADAQARLGGQIYRLTGHETQMGAIVSLVRFDHALQARGSRPHILVLP
jgi:hypothetical protein